MVDFSDLKIKVEKEKDGVAKVKIGPLPRGYGNTLGNALRRALLSSIEGAAVTSVKIEGVSHEYSTVEGMLEDVFNFFLNIRGIAFVMHSDEPQTIKLKASGKKEVTVGDLELTSDIEVANPDFILAHLTTAKAKLDVEMIVEKGIGFVFADDTKRSEVGVIPVDANYSPIIKVAFNVSEVRVGQKTDLDEIVFNIQMRENMSAKEAILQSCRIIADGYVQIIKAFGEVYEDEEVFDEDYEVEIIEVEEPVEEKKSGTNGVDLSTVKIEELHVSARVVRAMYEKDIETVDKLLDYTEEDIRALKGMGAASLRELKEALKKLGITLKEE